MNKKILTLLLLIPLTFACNPIEKGSGSGTDTDPDTPKEIDTSTDVNIHPRTDVPLKAFHADVFSDGGIHASSMTNMPAADMLGLSFEYLCTHSSDYDHEDSLAQDNTFIGNSNDLNGKLLYPDGAPRYRVVFVNGGNASSHGKSLKPEGRATFRKFVENGGSYIGSCAGAYVAAIGSDSEIHDTYIGLWPGRATNCHLSDTHTDQIINEDSPLLKYYSWTNNHIDNVYHNGGCCYDEQKFGVNGTEVLSRFDYNVDPSKHNYMHMKGAIWAYKASITSGRVIMSGSHPENVKTGPIRDLMAGMLRYAMDGQGITTIKGIIHNGETRIMDKPAGDPQHATIGDKQCHHFAMWVPEGAKNIKLILQPKDKFNFSLRLSNETYAYAEDAQYSFDCTDGNAAVAEFPSLPAGQWYICVQCTSDVTAMKGVRGTTYVLSPLLNGIPYSISLSWK